MIADLIRRLRMVLPDGWFADVAPTLDAVLTGLATAWASLFALLAMARAQTRLATMTDTFLDLASADWFGSRVSRRAREADSPFRSRISAALLRSRATRAAVTDALTGLTGVAPALFEPARPFDTGAWNIALGWGVGGGWGSLLLPFQTFVVAQRAQGGVIAGLAGYDTGGGLAYADLTAIAEYVTDAEIYASVADALPAGTIAWVRID